MENDVLKIIKMSHFREDYNLFLITTSTANSRTFTDRVRVKKSSFRYYRYGSDYKEEDLEPGKAARELN
jgi:hypothetical protein